MAATIWLVKVKDGSTCDVQGNRLSHKEGVLSVIEDRKEAVVEVAVFPAGEWLYAVPK